MFKNPNQLLPGSVQGDGFSGFRKTCPSLAAPASPGGSSSHSAPSQREGPAPAEDLQPESIFWKQEPLSFQNHSSLTLFRPQLNEEMVFQTKSYSTHSSDRHLLQLSVSERPCSVCCGTLRVFHILPWKWVPFSLQYSWSFFNIHGAGQLWRCLYCPMHARASGCYMVLTTELIAFV